MIRKIFSLLFLFIILTSYFIFPSATLAIDPIIIEDAIHDPPPAQADPNKQPDHFSNDTAKNELKCTKVVKISNTFQPKLINPQITPGLGAGQGQGENYKPYFVDTIKGTLNFTGQYSNTGINWLKRQVRKSYSGTISMSDPSTIKKAFTNFDATKSSADSAATRNMPAPILNCLKGRRLAAAVNYALDPKANSVVNNEAVACYKGSGTFQVILGNEVKCAHGYVITLTDIAHFITEANQSGQFYYPTMALTLPNGTVDNTQCGIGTSAYNYFFDASSNCNDPKTIGFPEYGISTKAQYKLTGAEACYLYKHLIEPADNGSNAQKVRIISQDRLTNSESVEVKERSIPSGNTTTYTDLAKWTIPATQTDKPVDLCQTNKEVNSVDRPNQFSVLAFIKDAFGWVRDTVQTFTGGVTVITRIDERISTGIARDNTFVNNLLPIEQQKRYDTLNSSKSSSDNDRNIDPGNPLPRYVLNQNLLPNNFFN